MKSPTTHRLHVCKSTNANGSAGDSIMIFALLVGDAIKSWGLYKPKVDWWIHSQHSEPVTQVLLKD